MMVRAVLLLSSRFTYYSVPLVVAVTIGFQYSSYTGNTGTSLTLCTTMYSGTTQRLVSVFATTVSKEAIGNLYHACISYVNGV